MHVSTNCTDCRNMKNRTTLRTLTFNIRITFLIKIICKIFKRDFDKGEHLPIFVQVALVLVINGHNMCNH